MRSSTMHANTRTALAVTFAAAASALAQDTWSINMTVDNQFDAYVGTASATVGAAVGSSSNWRATSSFTVTGMLPTDYFYVATASDWTTAQGFLGEFNNVTQGYRFNTGSPAWEVFPVGTYLQAIDPSWPSTWYKNIMPTRPEVDEALAYGFANPAVWVTPAEYLGWDNRLTGNNTVWGNRAGIDPNAEWIWNNTGAGNPFKPGANHDEFLIFRVPGIPAPGPLAVLSFGGLIAVRRRR